MSNIFQSKFIAKITDSGTVNFFIGADPECLNELPANAQFTVVYSPTLNTPWEVVEFCVIEPKKAYAVIKRRELVGRELSYFETLSKFNQLKQRYQALSSRNQPHSVQTLSDVRHTPQARPLTAYMVKGNKKLSKLRPRRG